MSVMMLTAPGPCHRLTIRIFMLTGQDFDDNVDDDDNGFVGMMSVEELHIYPIHGGLSKTRSVLQISKRHKIYAE